MIFFKKNNYRAWTIEPQNFPEHKNLEEKIKFLLNFAILAPSGHNSQPWNFKLRSNTLDILVNKKRFLTGSDPQGRQTFISLGCLIDNLLLAANYYGLQYNIQYFSNAQMPELVASVEFIGEGKFESKPGHLINYINTRLSNRTKYDSQIPEQKLITEICSIATSGLTITAVTGENKNLLAEIMIQAQIEVMNNNEFRRELSGYIKSNTTSSYYGMPGFTLEIPLPISYLASNLIKRYNLSKMSKKQDLKLLTDYTPIIFVVSSEYDEKRDWLATGKVLENLWLTCTKNNLSCSPLAAGVQAPNFRKKIQGLLNLSFYPQAILRCGHSKHKVNHSPRFNLENFIPTG